MNPPSGWHACASAHAMLRHSSQRELNVSHSTDERLARLVRFQPVMVVEVVIGLPLAVCIIAFCVVARDRSNGGDNQNTMIDAHSTAAANWEGGREKEGEGEGEGEGGGG